MKTAKEIRMYFDSKRDVALKKLQDKCKHEHISDWLDQYWAVGHSTGKQVKVCNACEKILETKGGISEMSLLR
jgi:hypothetical protein